MRALLTGVVPVCLVFCLAPQDPISDAKMLKQAQELARLAEPHHQLARLVGEWDVQVRTTPTGGSEQVDRGRVEATSMLGGRYIWLDFHLKLHGVDVEAVQMLGFDTLRQLYTASWRDDQSTWAVDCAGTSVAGSPDLLRLQGTLADAHDPTGRPFRLDLDLEVKDRVRVQLFDTQAGQPVLLQTQDWQRR